MIHLGFVLFIQNLKNVVMMFLILQFFWGPKFPGLHFTEGVISPKGSPLVKSTSGDPGYSWLMRLLADPQCDQEQMYNVSTFSKLLLT